MFNKSVVFLLADIILLVSFINTLPFDSNVTLDLSILIFIGILWLTEAIHLSVTALLVPGLAVFLCLYSAKRIESFC